MSAASLDLDHARLLYREMLRIRRFEERCVELYSASKIRGFLHLYLGEEAVAVGSALADHIAASHDRPSPPGAKHAMNNADIRHVVETAIHRIAPEVDIGHVPAETDLRQDLEIDSMDFLNYVDELHALLGLDIPEHDYPALATIEGCVQYLAHHLAQHDDGVVG